MPKLPSLPERIRALQEEIDEMIDQTVERERENTPGIPAGVLRNLLTARAGNCQCEAALQLAVKDADV